MSIVRKNKKILWCLLFFAQTLFANLDVDEIGFYFYMGNYTQAKQLALAYPEPSAEIFDFLARMDATYIENFKKYAQTSLQKAHLYDLTADYEKAKEAYQNALGETFEAIAIVQKNRTFYDTKSIALHELKILTRLTECELALCFIHNQEEKRGLELLRQAKGKGSDEELKKIHLQYEKTKAPKRGMVGWTLEGFASLENAKEFFILKNYFHYDPKP